MPIPTDHSKLVRKSAKESAFSQLLQWIIDGTLRPGEKLNDKELAEALGVSRTPIRESLQLLEAQGFVEMYPGKSTQVTRVEEESMKDILPPLAALQALAAELAVPHLTDEATLLLEMTNEQLAEAVRSKNYFGALKIDEEFHQIIVDTANNPYLLKMIPSLQSHVRRLFFHSSLVLTEKTIEEHAAIIKHLKDRDATGAAASMRKNWLRSIEEFRSLKSL
ncbi:GntR family transcriptional regulator [Pseudobacillus sp. FSL P4-0506]|uniref:GntR family transcriptional regulator n=1 Tax=unclassified Pseudobacillus TaxID=2619284 RepID=UPI0030F5869A